MCQASRCMKRAVAVSGHQPDGTADRQEEGGQSCTSCVINNKTTTHYTFYRNVSATDKHFL